MAGTLAFLVFGILGGFVFGQLLAAFVASQKWHWFIGFLVLIAMCLPLTLTGSPDLLIVVLIAPMITFIGVRYARHREFSIQQQHAHEQNGGQPKSKTSPLLVAPKFDLATLMLQIVALSIVFAIIYQAGSQLSFLDFTHYIGIGVAIGTWALFSLAIFYWKVPLLKKLLLFFLPLVGTWLWASLDDFWLAQAFSSQKAKLILWLIFLSIISLMAVMLANALRYAFPSLKRSCESNRLQASSDKNQEPKKRSNLRLISKCVVIAIVAMGFVSLASSYKVLINQASQSRDATPVDFKNSELTTLMKTSNDLLSSKILTMSHQIQPGPELRNEINNYAPQFATLHEVVQGEKPRWIDWSTGKTGIDLKRGFDLSLLRQPARALKMKARQERSDGNYDQAMQDSTVCFELGNRGGADFIAIIELSNIASRRIAYSEMILSYQNASEDALSTAAESLRKCEEQRPSVEAIIENEKVYATLNADWKAKLWYAATLETMMEPATIRLKEATIRDLNDLRQLRTLIALERFKREQGSYPESLVELSPDQLELLLVDPYSPTQGSFKYRLSSDGSEFKLYSVGQNGKDNNGVSIGIHPTGQDVDLRHNLTLEEKQNSEWIDARIKDRLEEESLLEGGVPLDGPVAPLQTP